MKKQKLNAKKIVKILAVLAVIAAVITMFSFLVAVNLQGLAYDMADVPFVGSEVEIVSEDIDSVTIKKSGDGEFKIMMFSDSHLNGKEDTDLQAVSYMLKNIEEGKPDLVVFGGDNISSGFNLARYNQFAEILEKTGVYWCSVLGNHESEGIMTYSRKKIVDIFASFDHCLMRRGVEDIDGYGNYTVNILGDDGKLQEVIFLMDSGTYMSDKIQKQYNVVNPTSHYDGVKESQVQWYKEKHDAIEKQYGEFKSITVIHIPPYESNYTTDIEPVYGTKNEGMCPAGFNSGIFDAMKEKGSIQAIYFGHDHTNYYGVMYEGVLLSYIQSAGYSSYNMGSNGYPESEWVQGCTILTLNEDGTYETENVFNHADA